MKDKMEELRKQFEIEWCRLPFSIADDNVSRNRIFNWFVDKSSQLEPPVKQMLAKEPFTLIDILETLNKATNILLHEKDYDGNDYEQMEYCLRRSQLIVESGNVTIKI